MRVLHIAQSISGGIASYLEEIAAYQTSAFGENGVRFLIPAGHRQHVPSIACGQIVEFSPCERSCRGLLALATASWREIRRFAPAIVHLHSTFAGAIARPVSVLQPARPRVIYCPHGWAFGMEASRPKRVLFAWIERLLAPLSDAIVNISHWEHELARENGLDPQRMVTIRNGVAPLPTEDRSSLSFEEDRIHLIFVGRHDRQKGLDILLDVFAEADSADIHLHVVGAPVVDSTAVRPRSPSLSNVTHYGWLGRSEVSDLIARADALVMPSRWEGFGLTALEAMRAGKPVLASRRGALTEIVEHGRSGFHFDPENRTELLGLLKRLDKNELRRMGAAAHSRFLGGFTSERLNSELVALYHTVIENRGVPSSISAAHSLRHTET
jgi:glycosyltransferase involved in cell wall biosynthesis